ncbi:calponin homology domain-containing protein [Leucosporidium creatinivorum]|uniref:Calponin homology domain-containing protein n=1 Tax=Leucosporidium creatinivorum TaxID=106004 RepID=A0A1Y2D9X0_9BASI|nr:calponin homology domain-containing protein [Leucosporidium creatinivorum]
MSDPFRRPGGPFTPVTPQQPPSRSPSPTKLSRPLSLFGPPSSSSNTAPTATAAGASNGANGLQRRPTHRTSSSMSSISLSGLSLSGVSASHASSPGMVHSPTFNSFSPTSPAVGPGGGGGREWGTFGATMDKHKKVGAEHEDVQSRVFCKWLNARLEPRYPPLTDLGSDFMDGTRLIQLVEVLTDSSLGRYNTAPNHRVQRFENAKQALDRIKELGVHLTNIGPEDIVDGNRKLILGMIWSLVLRFSIADIQEEGTYAKEGLLLWCQRKTKGYEEVDVQDFRSSWKDGLAFCALIHRHRPDLLDWESLSKDPRDAEENMRRAFRVAEESLGIPQLLDVEDVCGKRPDERSVMTYVAQYFHAFSSTAQAETESKVISTFVENMSSLMVAVNDYEARVGRLLHSLQTTLSDWSLTPPSPPYSSLTASRTALDTYRQTSKPEWSRERGEVEELLLNIQTKLKTYGLSPYEPTEEVCLATIENKWGEVLDTELQRRIQINSGIRQIQNDARRRFADLANALQLQIADKGWELVNISGSLENQLTHTHSILASLPSLSAQCDPLKLAEEAFIECQAEYNDWTVHSVEELEREYMGLEKRARARKVFIEQQIVARKATTVSPKDLEEFDSAFRSFDKDLLGRLDLDQLAGALGALGVAEIDLEEIHAQVGDEVTYEEFIQFMVARSEERPTGDKVRSCFRSTAGGKPYITELDLRRLDLPASAIKFLLERLDFYEPQVVGEDGALDVAEEDQEGARDYEAFLRMFMEAA